MPQLPRSQIRTRSNQEPGRTPTYEEFLKKNKELIKSTTQAREYLEKQGYTLPDEQGGRTSLSYTLLLLLHATTLSILPKGIRAVAMLLEHEEASRTADTITATIMSRLDPVLEHMALMADLVQEVVFDIMKAVDQLYRTGEETRDELQKGMEEAKEDIQRMTEGIKDEVSRLTEASSMMAKAAAGPTGPHQGGDPTFTTYTEALSRKLPASHLSMLMQTCIKER